MHLNKYIPGIDDQIEVSKFTYWIDIETIGDDEFLADYAASAPSLQYVVAKCN